MRGLIRYYYDDAEYTFGGGFKLHDGRGFNRSWVEREIARMHHVTVSLNNNTLA